jgi:hypothetical protein
MLKRADSPYPGGPWANGQMEDPKLVDAVMYAQRGHGKRPSIPITPSPLAWRGVGAGPRAYSFTDAELLTRPLVRNHTVNRFGPVRGSSVFSCSRSPSKGCSAPPPQPASPCASPHQPHPLDKPFLEADKLSTLEKLPAEGSGSELSPPSFPLSLVIPASPRHSRERESSPMLGALSLALDPSRT